MVAVTFKGNQIKLQKILRIFTTIVMSSNALHGEKPKELGYLNAVTIVNLSYDSLLGNIPSSFWNVS